MQNVRHDIQVGPGHPSPASGFVAVSDDLIPAHAQKNF